MMPRKKQVAGVVSEGLEIGVICGLTADDQEGRERPAFESHCGEWESDLEM